MADLLSVLTELGFSNDPSDAAALESEKHESGANTGGAYSVIACMKKGDVTVHVEQNQASEDIGGMSAVVTHPAVALIESPKGRCAFNPNDLELAKALVTELS